MKIRRVVIPATIVVAAIAISCGQSKTIATDTAAMAVQHVGRDGAALSDFSGRGVAGGRAVGKASRMEQDLSASIPTAAPAPPFVAQVGERPSQLPQIPATGMIIRNGAVTVQVDSLERAIDAVRALAQRVGGYLGNVSMQTGERQIRSATMELKVPAARFDSVMTGMPSFGKVEHSSSTAEDVGEEYVDISARVANAKRLEARLVSLLASRTARLADVLSVERELARVRQEIERYEGRLRYLSTRVAISTIVASLHEKAPLIAAEPGRNIFVEAFKNAWRNFVRFLAGGIEALGVLAPLAALIWAGWIVWKRWLRTRFSPQST